MHLGIFKIYFKILFPIMRVLGLNCFSMYAISFPHKFLIELFMNALFLGRIELSLLVIYLFNALGYNICKVGIYFINTFSTQNLFLSICCS